MNIVKNFSLGAIIPFSLMQIAAYGYKKQCLQEAKPLEGAAKETAEKIAKEAGCKRKIDFLHLPSDKSSFALGDRLSLVTPTIILTSDNDFITGHEIAHVHKNHFTTSVCFTSLMSGLMSASKGFKLGVGLMGCFLLGKQILSRRMEIEADTLGARHASARGMGRFIRQLNERLLNEELIMENGSLPQKLRCMWDKITDEHPSDQRRLTAVKETFYKKTDNPPIVFHDGETKTLSRETSAKIRDMIKNSSREMILFDVESITYDPQKREDNLIFKTSTSETFDFTVEGGNVLDLVSQGLKNPKYLILEIEAERELTDDDISKIKTQLPLKMYDLEKMRIQKLGNRNYRLTIPKLS